MDDSSGLMNQVMVEIEDQLRKRDLIPQSEVRGMSVQVFDLRTIEGCSPVIHICVITCFEDCDDSCACRCENGYRGEVVRGEPFIEATMKRIAHQLCAAGIATSRKSFRVGLHRATPAGVRPVVLDVDLYS